MAGCCAAETSGSRMLDEGYVDSKFYQAAAPASLGERIAIAARDRIYREWLFS